jgi:hypothetical protein
MPDENNLSVADSIAIDPTDSTAYIFTSKRVTTAAANSRFRVITDTVVGAFPFHAPKVLTSYAVQPFVASRAFVTAQAARWHGSRARTSTYRQASVPLPRPMQSSASASKSPKAGRT